jgi:tripartite-type tricarboxylate transporter receptor subunit TctC
VYAPKGTPPEVIKKFGDAMRVAIKDPAFATRMAELGAEQIADARQTPEGLKTFLGSEITKWGGVIKAAGQFAD